MGSRTLPCKANRGTASPWNTSGEMVRVAMHRRVFDAALSVSIGLGSLACLGSGVLGVQPGRLTPSDSAAFPALCSVAFDGNGRPSHAPRGGLEGCGAGCPKDLVACNRSNLRLSPQHGPTISCGHACCPAVGVGSTMDPPRTSRAGFARRMTWGLSDRSRRRSVGPLLGSGVPDVVPVLDVE